MTFERISNNELETLRQRLSARDLAIIHTVLEHQFLTTRQIMRLHFHTHHSNVSAIRACTRVLGRLKELRVLGRLDRVIGGVRRGSSSYVWCLDTLGDRLTRTTDKVGRRRFFQPSVTFLGHKLAIAETRTLIEEAARAKTFELLMLETEPHSWRTYLGRAGETLRLKPDLGATTATGEYEDHWFIEVDRGTESLRTLLEKCLQYETYRRSGREQTKRGLFPHVLWIMPTPTRSEQLRDVIHTTRNLDPRLFTIIAPEQLIDTIAGNPATAQAAPGARAAPPRPRPTAIQERRTL